MDDRPEATRAPAPPTPRAPAKRGDENNIKETIESILIAFVLAFIFRAFVVEAFVIPTGSMAPTLMGAHMRFTCPDCGYRFEVNFPTDSKDERVGVPKFARIERGNEDPIDRVFSIYCPNCGYKIPRHDPEDSNNSATAPPVRYGDRILVLKYLYLFQEPHRWDVVVFKAPTDPIEDDYSVNYIKRLVGKPGESIMILDGDVYVSQPGTTGEHLEDFAVQTKPKSVEDALWRIVYDNDFYPRGLQRSEMDANGQVIRQDPPWEQPWKIERGGRGWDLGTLPTASTPPTGRAFKFDSPDGGGSIAFDPDANPSKFSLTDWLPYDQVGMGASRSSYPPDQYDQPPVKPENNVSDVKLAFTYERHSGDGVLAAEITKFGRTFAAEIYPDRAVLTDDGRELGSVNLPLAKGMHRIELMNVDYQVTLRVDGNDIIQTTPAQYAPNMAKLMDAFKNEVLLPKPTIRIRAATQSCTLSHVGLWRDDYYGDRGQQSGNSHPFHASPRNFPDNIMHLGKEEYFVLGDNSPISGDARYWSDRIDLPNENLFVDSGRVPGRFLLGKAFFVYWPAGFRPLDNSPALAPNFGDMRLIH